jgi:hypothetical protein
MTKKSTTLRTNKEQEALDFSQATQKMNESEFPGLFEGTDCMMSGV